MGAIVLAACALPGVMPRNVQAEEAPEKGVLGFKLSHYTEWQAGRGGDDEDDDADEDDRGRATPLGAVSRASGGGGEGVDRRMTVNSPSLYLLLPLGRRWAAEGSVTLDEVSGASPRYYSDMSGASPMTDRRVASDMKLTRYGERHALALGLAHSTEHDYVSNALSLEGRWASEDNNTTWNLGLGLTRDTINPANDIVSEERKTVRELQIGVTQAVSRHDLVQLSATFSQGEGYYNDPYKLYDSRPRQRNARIALLRWNHWLGGSTLKTSYRFYRDSYRLQAHTLELNWVRPLGPRSTLTPLLRYHSQRAAWFYGDPASDASVYPGPVGDTPYFSPDQRLSAFGALAAGLKYEWKFSPGWTADARFELFQQRANWRIGGQGSPGVDPLSATQWQLGLSREF